MTNLVDVFTVFRSVEFLEKYETDEERQEAMRELHAKALSSFCHAFGYVILACLIVVLIKLI